MNKTRFWLFLFGSTSFVMHLYPFWMVGVFGIKHPLGLWKDSLAEILLNLLCAALVQSIIFRRFQNKLSISIGLLAAFNFLNIVVGLQVYAFFGLIVDVWSILFSLLLKRESKSRTLDGLQSN